MTMTITQRITDFKSDEIGKDIDEVIQRHIPSGRCHALDREKYFDPESVNTHHRRFANQVRRLEELGLRTERWYLDIGAWHEDGAIGITEPTPDWYAGRLNHRQSIMNQGREDDYEKQTKPIRAVNGSSLVQ